MRNTTWTVVISCADYNVVCVIRTPDVFRQKRDSCILDYAAHKHDDIRVLQPTPSSNFIDIKFRTLNLQKEMKRIHSIIKRLHTAYIFGTEVLQGGCITRKSTRTHPTFSELAVKHTIPLSTSPIRPVHNAQMLKSNV